MIRRSIFATPRPDWEYRARLLLAINVPDGH
jgi:hypothetical protein